MTTRDVPTDTNTETTETGDEATAEATRVAEAEARLPVAPRVARFSILLAVFVCAACGLVYELALIALGSYLIGDSVVQASIVLSTMVFAMGIGSLASKPLQRHAAVAFAVIELLLALLGGLSVFMLYASFAWMRLYTPPVVAISFVVGLLIGAEIPLLMTLIQRIRRQDAARATADLFAADYVGALLGGLAFPFVLLPTLGLIRGALAVGALNALAGAVVVLWLFRRWLRRVVLGGLLTGMVAVIAVLAVVFAASGAFEVSARQAMYRDPIVYAHRSQYQEIVLTRSISLSGKSDLRLFLNGDLQFSSVDEYRYHESLVHPAMAGRHGRVLILGGGDGLALREVLRYPDVRHVTLVDLDPAVTRLGRTNPAVSKLNHHSLDDPRVHVLNTDAFTWLRDSRRSFDVIIADLPDPDDVPTAKVFSTEFYGLTRHALTPGGRLVVQAGSPFFAPKSYWCIEASIREAGFTTVPYHVDVPSFGNWGFVLAQSGHKPDLRLPNNVPTLRFLTPELLRYATVFPKDRAKLSIEPSTLTHPRILGYEREEWRHYH